MTDSVGIYKFLALILMTLVNCERVLQAQNLEKKFLAVGEAATITDQNSSSTYSNRNKNSFNSNHHNADDSVCGNTQKMADNCFRDLPPHLMEFLQTSKIAINEKDILSKCK